MSFLHDCWNAALWVSHTLRLTDSTMHVHAGLIVFFTTALILRKPLHSPLPLAAVALAEFLNEVFDYFRHGRVMPDTFADVLNTLLWPTLIVIALRAGVLAYLARATPPSPDPA